VRRALGQRPNGGVVTADLFDPVETIALDGRIVAVLIDSEVLQAEIWFALIDDWIPDEGDSRAVFYAHELPMLKTKTPQQLREIHKVKLAFGAGSRLRQ